MNLRTAAAVGAAFGILGVGSAFATFARVESMGKNSTYIMDDVSIFDNPANVNLYSNYLIGGFGAYTDNNMSAGGNVDPQHPTFGGIFAISFGDDNNPDPKFSIGGLFGRVNEDLAMYLPDYVQTGKSTYAVVPETVTNFDGFLGGTFSSGDAWGLHIYIAHQDGGDLDESGTYQTDDDAYASIVQLDGGLNFQTGSGTSYEVSGGIARVQYGPDRHSFFDDGDFTILAKARAFFTMEAIDGELVPAASIKLAQAPGIEDKHAQAGMGLNVAMDRGFFWLGLDFIWNQKKAHDWFYDKTVNGGAWVYGDKERYQWYCMDLALRGFAVLNFTYRLAPDFKFPASLEDACLVFSWVLDHAEEYGLDASKVFAVGDSAGAHLLGLFSNLCTNPTFAEKLSVKAPSDLHPLRWHSTAASITPNSTIPRS
jgi:hypothetical protein